MSPETYLSPTRGNWSDLRAVVESFYTALRERDADALAALVDQTFTPEAVVHEPGSLPYGGAHEGTEAIKRLFAELVSHEHPIDWSGLVVEHVMESAVDPDALDHVIAAIVVPWTASDGSATAMRALQWWTFERLSVAELRTYYWDTAALAGSGA